MERRTFFKIIIAFLAGLFIYKEKSIDVMQYYKKEFKRYLRENCKKVPSCYESTLPWAKKYNISDFHPAYQYGNAMRLNIKKIDEQTINAVHILADNCALSIPRIWRHLAELTPTKHSGIIAWIYNRKGHIQ